jgi:hypothetical protein
MRPVRLTPGARFAPRPLPGDPDWYVFELIAIQRAATANLQARMAKVQLGQDYPRDGATLAFERLRRCHLGRGFRC